jgi:hypothetical protein
MSSTPLPALPQTLTVKVYLDVYEYTVQPEYELSRDKLIVLPGGPWIPWRPKRKFDTWHTSERYTEGPKISYTLDHSAEWVTERTWWRVSNSVVVVNVTFHFDEARAAIMPLSCLLAYPKPTSPPPKACGCVKTLFDS